MVKIVYKRSGKIIDEMFNEVSTYATGIGYLYEHTRPLT